MEENTKNPTPPEETPADSVDTNPVVGVAVQEEPAPTPEEADLSRAASILESLLLVSSQPLSYEKIGQLLGGLGRQAVREVVRILQSKCPPDASGILVEEVAKGVQLRTNPANQEYVRRLFDVKPPRFSRAALETLSIIAYKQPATRLEIEQIRGVDCAGALKTLMDRRLVKVVGKKDVPGKPFLFATTREFLEVFGLASLSDLPSMRDIEDFLAAATGGVVAEAPAEPVFQPAGPRRSTSELAASLEEAEHGEPLVTTEPGLPEGVSDVVLSEAAAKEEGEGAEAEGAASGSQAEEPDAE
ncbi:MAG: SMC-Scp complex subunit ScpB [Deltaproteobacteria bacterium]|nr:SMC-Scp complex subunit ScpB [Deltaproteobacteria bacterium]